MYTSVPVMYISVSTLTHTHVLQDECTVDDTVLLELAGHAPALQHLELNEVR